MWVESVSGTSFQAKAAFDGAELTNEGYGWWTH